MRKRGILASKELVCGSCFWWRNGLSAARGESQILCNEIVAGAGRVRCAGRANCVAPALPCMVDHLLGRPRSHRFGHQTNPSSLYQRRRACLVARREKEQVLAERPAECPSISNSTLLHHLFHLPKLFGFTQHKFESRTVPFRSSESAQGPCSAETAATVHQLYAIHPGYNS